MKTINSISGGQTSAYVAANFPADYNLFALVTSSDRSLLYPDVGIRKQVSDRIGREFIGTLEDDLIIRTMFELEQYLGTEITWVSGITYDDVVQEKGGWLPNKLHRYCTSHLKLQPMFSWWFENIGEPVEMRIGFRANETSRKATMLDKVNADGFLERRATFGKNSRGQNKWEMVPWQRPVFPLIDGDPKFKDDIAEYWKGRPVTFAPLNNCVGCFHRNPLLLRKMFDAHPEKMEWFARQEEEKHMNQSKGCWRSDITYRDISRHRLQLELSFDDFEDDGCDSGYCHA